MNHMVCIRFHDIDRPAAVRANPRMESRLVDEITLIGAKCASWIPAADELPTCSLCQVFTSETIKLSP